MGLTWKQFKEYVDAQLKEKSIDENTEIWYVDFSFPIKADDLTVFLDEGTDSISIS